MLTNFESRNIKMLFFGCAKKYLQISGITYATEMTYAYVIPKSLYKCTLCYPALVTQSSPLSTKAVQSLQDLVFFGALRQESIVGVQFDSRS